MVDEILTGAGFIKNKTYRETQFLKPPQTTYAVYTDTIERRGGDFINLSKAHDVSIELYEYTPDPEMEAALEEQLDKLGLKYTKQARYRIESEQLYQVIYDFSYYEKKKGA